MNILVLNSGSSSIKYQLLSNEKLIAKGLIERVGLKNSIVNYKKTGYEKIEKIIDIPDHLTGVKLMLELLCDAENGVIKSIDEINAVGHRIVHGGDRIADSIIIDDDAEKIIEELFVLAPLHNPANLSGVIALKKLMPANIKHVGVFDTAFHQSMPKKAFTYALPYELYEKHNVRRFGFHGTSHQFVAQQAAKLINKPLNEFNCITAHLGNGSSLTAVKGGKSIDTTLGFGTMCGVPMGTRAGDFDPAIVLHMIDNLGYSSADVHKAIYKNSGFLGLSGISFDCRDILEAAEKGHERAQLAIDVFIHNVSKMVLGLACNFENLDAIIFTAGIGENNPFIRKEISNRLKVLGIEVDDELNNFRGEERVFSTPNSKVKLIVIPTNEELMIAKETMRLTQ